MFDPKIFVSTPSIVSIAGGCVFLIGLVITGTVKVMTKNNITSKEAYNKLQNIKNCDEKHKLEKERDRHLTDKIDNLTTTINTRFDDIKDLINGE